VIIGAPPDVVQIDVVQIDVVQVDVVQTDVGQTDVGPMVLSVQDTHRGGKEEAPHRMIVR